VVEGLLDRDGGKFGLGSAQERASGGRKPDAFDLVHATAAKALVDRIVLAVDGQQGLGLTAGFGGDELAGDDQAFLIGQSHRFAGFDRFVGGFESGDADDGADHEIDIGLGCDADGSCGAMNNFGFGESGGAKFPTQGVGVGFVSDRDDLGPVAKALVVNSINVVACCERGDLEAVGIAFDDAEGAASDGAGGTQDGDAFHGKSGTLLYGMGRAGAGPPQAG